MYKTGSVLGIGNNWMHIIFLHAELTIRWLYCENIVSVVAGEACIWMCSLSVCRLACLSTANVSVLRWWFEDKSARLIINESLRVELALAADQRFWEIRLSGITRYFYELFHFLRYFHLTHSYLLSGNDQTMCRHPANFNEYYTKHNISSKAENSFISAILPRHCFITASP